jgi:membrane protein DedA with SNARE-associated domain
VGKGVFTLWQTGLAGAIGCVVGSWVGYAVGRYGGRPFAQKYGRYILLNPHDLDVADHLFKKYGSTITFTSRLLPIIRTFIAFPAGVARMNVLRFSVYTFLGSLPWCLGLAWIGQKLGSNWMSLRQQFHQMDMVIALLIIVGGVFWIRHHILFLKSPEAS